MKTKILLFSVMVLSLVSYFSVAIAGMTWIPFNSGTEPDSPEVEALTSDINGIIIKFNMAGMFRTDKEIEGELYQLLNIPSGGHTAEIGSPEVPTVGRYIAVPSGASVSIEVISTKSKILDGYNIFPAQEPLPDDIGFDESSVQFQKNLQAYSTDAFYPISIAEVEQPKILRGLGVSLVGIFPVRFNPVSRQIEVYSEIEVRVSFNGGYGYFVEDKYRSLYFEPLYRNLLLNYGALAAFPEQTHTVDYLVITHDNYYSNILPLADWKHRKGLSTRILRVPTDVAASTSAIKDSIQSYYDNYGTSFVLFVGDASDIPTWYVTTHPYHYSKTATDIYYATVAGTDYFPDIFLGRLPINSASVDVVVNKILNYERSPYMGSTAWYNTPLVAGYFQDSYSPYGYADRFFLQTSETIRSFLGSMGYDITNYVYATNCTAPKPWYYYYGSPIPSGLVFTNPGTNEVINAINNGCFLIQHRDHGAISGWGDPAFYSSNIASLNNGEMLPVVYSVNCQTGWFDYSSDSFCETFLKKQNGGCVGIVGATRVSYSGHNDELSKGFYDAIWPNFDPTYPTASSTNPLLSSPYCNLGIILNFAKFWMYDKYVLTGGAGYPWSPSAIIDLTTFEMFHVFGCPEMELWTDVPAPLTVNHPTNIPVGTSSSITVTVQSSGSPVQNALVCLVKDGDIYDRAFTPSSGQVTFTVNPPTPGNIYVTVTKHNFQPYEGTITCTGGTIGTLAGTVTNAATGNPILAMITIKETGQQTTTNPATGYYSMFLIPGTYTAKASANGFAPDSTIVTILQNQTTIQDFALAPVGITVLPDSFNIVLKQGTNGTRVMTIRNDGSGLLAYQILWNFSEAIGTGAKTPFAPIMSIKLKIPEKMDPVAGYASKMNNLLEQAANDICPSPIRDIQAPEAIWDLLFDYDVQTPTGDNQCLGVEFDGTHFWITGGGGTSGTVTNKLHKFDRDGNYIQSFDQGTISDWGWRDLTWDGTYLYASDEYELAKIDPTTGSKVGTLTMAPTAPNRALAYDPATGHFWTANFFSDIYEFDGSGSYWIYPNTMGYAIYGMAWDDVSAGGPWLWIWSQDGTPAQLCSQYDPINHQFTGVTYQGKGTYLAGGACFIPDWQTDASFAVFVGLDQTEPDHIMGYEMGTGILTNWWLAVDPPLNGTIAAGTFAQNTVQFRTTYEGNTLPVGDYYATITVVNNNPITPTVNIPVHLIVEAVDPDINVNPLSFDVTLPSGGSTTETLNIANTGSGTLGFAIYEGQAGDEAGFIKTKDDDPVVIGTNSHRPYDFVTGTKSVQDDNLPLDYRRPGPIPIDIGQIVHHIPAPGGSSNGLTWDGTHLWATDFMNSMICKLNPETGTIIVQFPAPGATNPSDLAWDGSSLWHHDFGTGIVYQLNPSTGAVMSSFTEPTIDISEGLTWDGQYLWIGGYNSIYQVTTSGIIINSIPAPGVPGTGIDGLTWDGTYLWVIGYDLIIYQVDPGDGTIIKYFATPSASPNGLAFDGAFLWNDDGVQGVINQIDIELMFNIPWLSEDPTSGLVPPGSDATKPITIAFDATGCSPGDHYAKLYIISNDPDEPLVTVPVHMKVGPGGGVDVVIPDTTGVPGTLIGIPINVTTDVTGMGIFAAEIELSWKTSVLDNASAAPGSMVPSGWLFNYNSTPGSGNMTIWMAGTESIPPSDPLAGTGSLVMLTFDVVGQHCDTTTIHFNKMMFNEGNPAAITHDGFFHAIECWDIAGHIYYCLNNDPVDDAIVPVLSTPYKDTTDVNGNYELLCLPPGNYVVKPEKENDLGTPAAISAFDAAWILQYGVGLRPFVPCQMIAADVTGNGSVTAYDAAMILQWGVGIIHKFPVMPDNIHFWRFVPDDFVLTMINWMVAPNSISYTPLNSNVVDNYKAILYGDVSGNWHPTEAGLAKATAVAMDIRIENVYGKAGDKVSLPINVDNASDIIAMNFTLEYDHQVLKAVGASLTSLTQDYLIAHDIKDGLFKVALAGSQPIVGSGAVVNLEFEVLDTESPDAGCALEITEMVINDGSIAANIQVARFESGSPVPDEYVLHQNYPNPFNPETSIKYQLPKSGKVVLKIYNSLGQEIRTLVNEEKEAGYHEARWDGRDNNGVSVSSGIYIYRIQAGDFISSKKMIFMM